MQYVIFICALYIHTGECIAGWDVAVSTMRKGELSRYLISPVYAYGELGCPPRIPPNSTSKQLCLYEFANTKRIAEIEVCQRTCLQCMCMH